MRNKPKVGQKLFSLNIGNASRRSPQVLTPVIVKSVGRKFFVAGVEGCADHSNETYHLDTWHEKTNSTADSCLYETEKEWADEKEAAELCAEIGKAFEYGSNRKNLSLEKLRSIKAILQ